MRKSNNPFSYKRKKLEDDNVLYMINIEEIDTNLKTYFDYKLTKISEGNRDIDLAEVKLKLFHFFKTKKGSDIELGAIAELVIHFFMSTLNFKQEFLYTNLEENSLKKGFDGYYTKANEEWILESKSGSITTVGISHQTKISEAYLGIKNKIEGKDNKNNPWENAYKHATHSDVKSKKSIKDKLNQLSKDYFKKNYPKIDKFNVIPCSTIFLEEKWDCINEKDLIEKIKKTIIKKDFKKIVIICINKKSLKYILDYLKP